nr:hypothetical protein Iba_chr11eCG11310 [Ipomoea batatas]GMD58916.1 hypothetical protein Iba_chr11fCG10160 [Ipomoea batatas]
MLLESRNINGLAPSFIKKFIDGYSILSIRHGRRVISPFHPRFKVIFSNNETTKNKDYQQRKSPQSVGNHLCSSK